MSPDPLLIPYHTFKFYMVSKTIQHKYDTLKITSNEK